MLTIKIVDLLPEDWTRAARLANQFLEEFPDKPVGIYHGCVYSNNIGPDLYVYKTKTQVVVRNTNGN